MKRIKGESGESACVFGKTESFAGTKDMFVVQESAYNEGWYDLIRRADDRFIIDTDNLQMAVDACIALNECS